MKEYLFIINMAPEGAECPAEVTIRFETKDWFEMPDKVEVNSFPPFMGAALFRWLERYTMPYWYNLYRLEFPAAWLYAKLETNKKYPFVVKGDVPEDPLTFPPYEDKIPSDVMIYAKF